MSEILSQRWSIATDVDHSFKVGKVLFRIVGTAYIDYAYDNTDLYINIEVECGEGFRVFMDGDELGRHDDIELEIINVINDAMEELLQSEINPCKIELKSDDFDMLEIGDLEDIMENEYFV